MSHEVQPVAFEMDHPLVPDDQMEIGTSPYRPADDIDFEDMDHMDEPSVDNSMFDEVDFPTHDLDAMQPDANETYRDDEMYDEDTNHQVEFTALPEVTMEDKANLTDADEEILYDEDDDVVASAVLGGQDTKFQLSDPSDKILEDVKQASADATHWAEVRSNRPENGVEIPTTVTDRAESVKEVQLDEGDQGEAYSPPGVDHTNIVDFANERSAQQAADEGIVQPAPLKEGEMKEIKIQEESTEVAQYGDDSAPQPDAVTDDLTVPDHSTGTNPMREHPTDMGSLSEVALTTKSEGQEELQSIKIVYLGEEMSLFPPTVEDSSTTFFLSDPSLASETFEKLLFACREILGDSLGHEDELILDIPALGLHISEDSKYASTLNLTQVTQVYQQLCRNDHPELVEPLYCNISSRVCLATQYEYLSSAAQEGRSFSEIAADYVDTPEPEAESFEDVEAQDGNRHIAEDTEVLQSHQGGPEAEADAHTSEQLDLVGISEAEREEYSQDNATDIASAQEQVLSTDAAGNDGSAGDRPIVSPEVQPKELLQTTTEEIDHVQLDGPDLRDNGKKQEVNDLSVPDLQDESIATHEHQLDTGTSSSHTVKAEELDFTESVTAEAEDAEDEVVDGNAEPAVDSADFNYSELPTDAGVDDLDHDYTTADTFEPSFEDYDDEENARAIDAFVEVPNDPHPDKEDVEHVQDITDEREVDVLNGLEASPELIQTASPVTPSKQSSVKRKAAQEEDDLDFIDFSTPEPKRSRPS